MIKNVTLSAEEMLIRQAREKAMLERKSLNALFREWLAGYVGAARHSRDYGALMRRLQYAVPGRRFARDEANAR